MHSLQYTVHFLTCISPAYSFPDSSIGSDISSASKLASTIQSMRNRKKKIGDRMLTNVTIISRQYKDILIR